MSIRDFLKQNNALSKEIAVVDYHMELLSTDLEVLKAKIPALKEKSDRELVEFIALIYNKCNILNPEYDSQLDMEMVRIGLKTQQFYGGHSRSRWNKDTFYGDYDFGNELSSIYDDYVDDDNERMYKSTH